MTCFLLTIIAICYIMKLKYSVLLFSEDYMIIAGIILICLQVIVIIVSYSVGLNPLGGILPNVIGYLMIGIVGLILLIVGYRRKRKRNKNNNEKNDKER